MNRSILRVLSNVRFPYRTRDLYYEGDMTPAKAFWAVEGLSFEILIRWQPHMLAVLNSIDIHYYTTSEFLAATKQLYEWFSPSVRLSVRLSVCPSVCHTFLTMFPSFYHHEIFRSYYEWQKWRPCKRSRSEVKGQGHRGHNPTSPFPDCNSSLNSHMMIRWCI